MTTNLPKKLRMTRLCWVQADGLPWNQQKAVYILLTLLYLGIKNIRLGPSLPAFVPPSVLNYLSEHFGIAPVTTPEEDLQLLLR